MSSGNRPFGRQGSPFTSVKNRALKVTLVLSLAFVLLIGRALLITRSDDRRLERLARIQHTRRIQLPSARGTIYDSKGEPLALTVPVSSLFAEPTKVSDPDGVAARLAPILRQPAKGINAKLKGERAFVWLKRKVDSDIEVKIAELRIPGIGFRPDSIRSYPFRELTACVLGAVGLDQEPLGGVELAYNSVLASPPRTLIVGKDARGEQFILEDVEPRSRPRGDLVLTLDQRIQYILEEELEASFEMRQAKGAMGIVMDIPTGGILAMANLPCFNPNAYAAYGLELWKNRLITDPFEPGSTFKVILAAAALESGTVKPDDLFDCGMGELKIGNHVIHDPHPHGRLTFREILEVSSNIGAARVQQQIGSARFFETIRAFGFGGATGIDLPGESPGQLPAYKNWSALTAGTMSFGQGISVTGLQLIAAIAAIARGGVGVTPHIADRILGPEGEIQSLVKRGELRTVMHSASASILTEMMEGVTSSHGTAPKARVLGYRVAGKTGTAQKVTPGTKGYSDDKFIASFVGFLPVSAPRVAILIVVDEPKGTIYGGEVAGPVFRNVASKVMAYLAVPPDAEAPDDALRLVDRDEGLSIFKAAWHPEESPPEDLDRIPLLVGLSLREAASRLIERGLGFEVQGEGFVAGQSCPVGESVLEVEKCLLKLEPPL